MTIAPSVYISTPGTLFDQSGISISHALKISNFVTAESFTLTGRRTLTTITAALNDIGPDNGVLDGFSGTLSWGIYSSVGGAPGTLLFSGSDSTPLFEDTGLSFTGSTDDIVRTTIDLGVTLDAGDYFIALHEGAWGSAFDGSEIYWMRTSSDLGSNGASQSETEANPSQWLWTTDFGSMAFSLNETPVYAATEQVSLNLKGNVSIADSDVGGSTMTVTLSVGYGILTATAGDSGANVSGSGTDTIILTGTLAQVNDLLGANSTSSFTFTANTDAPPASTVLTVTAQEPGDATPSAPATQTITIAAVNDAPTVSIAPSGTIFNQSILDLQGANGISSSVNSDSFTLAERRMLTTITAALNDNGPNNGMLDGFSGTLSWGIYSSVSGAPGTLLFSGTDSTPLLVDSGQNFADGTDVVLATIDLGNVTLDAGEYFLALHEGAWGSAYDNTQIFWVRSSTPQDAVGSHASFNLANPSAWLSEGQAFAFALEGPSYASTEQVAFDLKGRVSVADDSGNGNITVTLGVGYGILTVTAGTSGANVSGSGTGTVTLTGTLAQINDLLNTNTTSSVSFTANTDTPPASTTLTVGVNDGGNSGSGGALTGSATQEITIAAVNDAPTAAVSASAYAATEQVALSLKGTVSVADADAGSGSVTVTLGVGYGVLMVTSGTSGANVSGSGTSSVTLTGTLAQINDLLGANATSTVSFTANTDTPPASTTLSVGINDGGNSGGGGGALTGSASQTINIAAVNDAPTATVSASAYAATEQVALNLKGTVSVADADAGTGSVTVTLGVGYGILTVSAGTSGANVTGSGTGTVTLTGTLAQISDLLNTNATSSVTFTANTDTPSASTTLTVGINDGGNTGSGGALTGSASQTINITAVNDAPTAAVSASAYAATEQVALSLKGTVSVADADAGSGSVTVTLGVGYGVLTVTAGTSGANVSGSGTNSVTLTGTLAQINDLLNTNATSSVNFTANTDTPPASTTLTVGINDGGNSGTGGALTGSASQTITITAVNDLPVGVADGYSTDEDTALIVGSPGVLVNDTDAEGSSLTAVLVTGPLHGVLAFSTIGGFTYTPDADYHGSDSFSYRPNDGTANGNITTVNLTVNSVNDAPANLAIDSDRINEGAAAGTVVGTASASDVDGDAIIWSLSGADAGLFHIDANGVITTTGTTATFESRPSYSLTVRA
ncbi:beta strand repeat-containing protein, partial [Sphingomonas colocasiae]